MVSIGGIPQPYHERSPSKQTQETPHGSPSTRKPSAPQNSLSNSYSSLSGSEASMGIDCQAHRAYHLRAM